MRQARGLCPAARPLVVSAWLINADDVADACRVDCRASRCGDGTIDTGAVCDDGNDVTGDGCRGDCSGLEFCGNQVVDPGSAATMATRGARSRSDHDTHRRRAVGGERRHRGGRPRVAGRLARRAGQGIVAGRLCVLSALDHRLRVLDP
jgi:cysteine-rich repeat protein